MTLQFRPKAAEGAPMYAPDRDIAHNFPELVRTAMYTLHPDALEAPFRAYLAAAGVTDDDLCRAAVATAEGLRWMTDDETDSAAAALAKAGFFDLPFAAQVAVCCRIGQVLFGAFFVGVREVLEVGAPAPASIKNLCAEAADLVRAAGTPKEAPPSAPEAPREYPDEQRPGG